MAYAGQRISNPVTGENFTFIKTSRDTDGEALVFDCRVEPGKATLPPHVHDTQEERFKIKSGRLGVMLGSKQHVLEAGEGIILPAGIKHRWWNAGDEDVEFRVEAVPARNLEVVLEVNANLARAGKLGKKGMPRNPFYLANLGRLGETYLPGLPIWMQKVGLAMGSMTGRLVGVDPSFKKYRTAEVEEVEVYEARAA